MTCQPVVAQSPLSSRCAASSAKRAPVRGKSLQRGSQSFVTLMRSCQNGCKKPSVKAIYSYLAMLEAVSSPITKQSPALPSTPQVSPNEPPHPLRTISVRQATWLFFRKTEDLDEEEQKKLELVRQCSPRAEMAYQLVEAFLQMLRQRTGEQLDTWLQQVEASHLETFEPFVTSMQKDKDAVLAGLTLPWSNGPLEGNVNRLKLIKRSMYGQANLDLLKRRVLYTHKKRQKKKKGHTKLEAMRQNSVISRHTTLDISKVA